MARQRAANENEVRAFAVGAVVSGAPNLAHQIQNEFGVSRPTSHNYIRSLIEDGVIVRERPGRYRLAWKEHEFDHDVAGLEEDRVWKEDVLPLLVDLPENVLQVCNYGCTEMINNVIDHSGSEKVKIIVNQSPVKTEILVSDSGVGIFRKIATELGLEDDRHAVLELSKGKVTTDPENHTGEGIFFSSRAFDRFSIYSGGVIFTHDHDDHEDWIVGGETPAEKVGGTIVTMTMQNTSTTSLRDIFDQYSTDTEEYRFDKTVVPVKLLQYGDDRLVSRSQAKRLMNRFDRFGIVVLNFEGVPEVGQAFADEVFRVFPSQHPEVEVIAVNANEAVARMMNRAISNGIHEPDASA